MDMTAELTKRTEQIENIIKMILPFLVNNKRRIKKYGLSEKESLLKAT